MKLRRGEDGFFHLEVSNFELDAFQSGLRETLEALDDWEFQTRTGLTPGEMEAILDQLVTLRKEVLEH